MYRRTCVGGVAVVGSVHALTDCHSGVFYEWCWVAMLCRVGGGERRGRQGCACCATKANSFIWNGSM